MRNIGPKTTAMLSRFGIFSRADIQSIGTVAVYSTVVSSGVQRNNNLLWGLYGAEHDISWLDIPRKVKLALLEEVELYITSK